MSEAPCGYCGREFVTGHDCPEGVQARAIFEAGRNDSAWVIADLERQLTEAIERGVGMYNKVQESVPIMETFAWCADQAATETRQLRQEVAGQKTTLHKLKTKWDITVRDRDHYKALAERLTQDWPNDGHSGMCSWVRALGTQAVYPDCDCGFQARETIRSSID